MVDPFELNFTVYPKCIRVVSPAKTSPLGIQFCAFETNPKKLRMRKLKYEMRYLFEDRIRLNYAIKILPADVLLHEYAHDRKMRVLDHRCRWCLIDLTQKTPWSLRWLEDYGWLIFDD